MRLSPNFTLEELTRSEIALRLGLVNDPNEEQIRNLGRLCRSLLEPIRTILCVPLHVNSGFRSEAVNKEVGGSPTSAHMDGRAADIYPIGMPLRQAFDTLRRNTMLPIDQLIIECDSWLHCAMPKLLTMPRRQFLVASGRPGAWKYEPVGE